MSARPPHEEREPTREPPDKKKVTTRVPDTSPMWPMWRYTIVALAVLCLGMLGWYGATRYPGRIESDLAARAQKALDSRVPGLVVKASERTLVLQGVVKDEALRVEIEQLASDLPGVKEVNSTLTIEAPAPIEPTPGQKALLDLEIVWSGKAIELRGSLPKALQKDFDLHLISSFGTEDVVVSRRIGQPEGEAPKEGKAQLEDAINALVQMSSGRARIAGGALAISGVVPSSEVEGRVMAIAAKAKAQVSLVVRAPTAEPTPADVVEPVPDTSIADVPPDVPETATAEVAPTDAPSEVVQADTGPVPTDAMVTEVAVSDVTPVPAGGPLSFEQCRDAIRDSIEAEKRITFDTGTARLTDDGRAKVDAIWGLLQRCPNAKGVIEGYHDDLGDPDKIKGLTVMRAAAVYKRLLDLGMVKGRFKYYGLGYRNMRFGGKPDRRVLNQRVEIKLLSE